MERRHIETLAVHAAWSVDPATGAIAPPLVRSTTFERDADGGYVRGFQYGRDGNPNRNAFESAMAVLEGGTAGVAFSSGNAASSAVLQLATGGHLVTGGDGYYGTRKLVAEYCGPLGITVDEVDCSDLDALRAAVRTDTRMVWIETPSNPLLDVYDIAAIAEILAGSETLLVCDNTFATPILQNPLALGADLVVHSATKSLGGHSDVMAGIVVTRGAGEHLDRLRRHQSLAGAIPSPADCWLLQRSLPTLPLRVRAASATAALLATWLCEHPSVIEVRYPGLPSHPGHALAARQMTAGGPMLSFRVAGGATAAIATAAATELFTRATSLGGVESLIEHRASMEGAGTRAPDDLLRVSVGLEHVEDLQRDLARALENI